MIIEVQSNSRSREPADPGALLSAVCPSSTVANPQPVPHAS